MIILLGESGVGKSVIRQVLCKNYGYDKVISCTTRLPRLNEINGKDYYFITKEEFSTKIQNQEFVEYSIYKEDFYGILKSEFNKKGIIIMEPLGFYKIKQLLKTDKKSNEITSFLLIATEQERGKRMLKRGDGLLTISNKITEDKKHFNIAKLIEETNFALNTEKYSVDELACFIHLLYNNQKTIRKDK